MRRMRGVGVAVAVAVALAASGCSDDGDAAVPEDWVWFEGDGYAVAHPPEWQEAPEAFGEFTEMAVEGEPLGDTVPPVLTVDVERGPSAVATTAEQSGGDHRLASPGPVTV